MRSTFPFASLLTWGTGRDNAVPRRRPVAERRASAPPSAFTGFWKGMLFRDGSGAVPFSLLQKVGADGETVGRMILASAEGAPAMLRVVDASAARYAAVAGPYVDRASGAELTMVIEGQLVRNKLSGTFSACDRDGVERAAGRFTAVRARLVE